MVLPTTYLSVLLLLLVSFVCLGSWPNTFKRSGTQWRFELFCFDFAFGALLLAVVASFTFGTFGSEMAFNDRILVAGRSAQAWVLVSGFLFNLGNMLLVAAISLVGMSSAFPLSIGLALIIGSLYNFRAGNIFFLIAGIVLLLVALVLAGTAARLRDFSLPKPGKPVPAKAVKAPQKTTTRRTTKGILIALASGIPLGLFYPLFWRGAAGEFGLGPYAGLLFFAVGAAVSTVVANFYFMNISIDGGPISFNAYFRGNARQHLFGFAGGALWAVGALTAILAASAPSGVTPGSLGVVLPIASALLALLWGALAWNEFPARSKNARISIGVTAVLFAGGLALVGTGLAR